jgi:Holliday junction resolvase YEN1
MLIQLYVSIWYYLFTAPFHVGHSNYGESPELRTFFSKLLRLSMLPVHIIFVFDGNQRPPIKRGTRVIDREHFLYRGMILLIEAFGFEYFTVSAGSILPVRSVS